MICLGEHLAANPYAAEIDAVLPRILALGDRDALSPTAGLLDRRFWGWKLIDFPNATFQGACNGLSTLVGLNAFAPSISTESIIARIVAMVEATGRITRSDGSLEEAFPFERSYCVTALVAFDILKALDVERVRGALGDERARRVLEPLIGFLTRGDETHGMISNHLATAAAALLRWEAMTGDRKAGDKGRLLLERILANACVAEGWFSEYGGADPGYQTLCLTYLADIALSAQAPEELLAVLPQSVRFLADFVHPDGSFGGVYGSRATRIFYPGGIELLTASIPEAGDIALRMRPAIADARTVPLRAIDEPNLMPAFNSYCTALAASSATQYASQPSGSVLARRASYPQAGLIVDRRTDRCAVISTRKGGVVYGWSKDRQVVCDTGVVVTDAAGRHYTGQTDDPRNRVVVEADRIVVSGRLRRLAHPLPGPLRFAALRVLAATVMRVPPIGDFVKKGLARYLVSGRRRQAGTFERVIHLNGGVRIEDRWEPATLRRVEAGPFSAIHMASQGYWQAGDDGTPPNGEAAS